KIAGISEKTKKIQGLLPEKMEMAKKSGPRQARTAPEFKSGFGLLQLPQAGDVTHRQGEHQGLSGALDARLGHDGLHNGLLRLAPGQDEDHLLLRRDGHAEKLPHQVCAGALGVDHRAAGGACLPGGVHHQVGGPLVGNDHDQIVGNLPFHSSFSLLFMQQIFLGGGSADAVHRHSHQNALAGHIQPQVTGRLAHQPGGPGGHAEQHGLLRGLQAQKVQHLRGGGALTQSCQHQRDPVGPEPGG
ncbi:2-C-methyl-D-erythritol 4-phosphate cytidylyltransferase, partial [Dysosmobacter welbionis]